MKGDLFCIYSADSVFPIYFDMFLSPAIQFTSSFDDFPFADQPLKRPPRTFSFLWSHYGYSRSRALELCREKKGNNKNRIQLQGNPFSAKKTSKRNGCWIHGTGIFTYIHHTNQPNVGEYTIHGSYG